MKLLRIFIIIFAIYPIVSFADSLDVNLVPVIKEDTLISLPSNNFSDPKDTSDQINSELHIPLITPFDSTGLLQPEKIIPLDSLGLIKTENKNLVDSLGLIQNENSLISDSIGLIQRENKKIDSLNIINIRTKDSLENRRIDFRSVYTDTTDINYIPPRKIIMFKWITDNQDTVIRFKNILGFNIFYGYYTYGLGAGIYRRISNDADFIANLNLTYLFDRRTTEDIDSTGNLTVLDKESRLYPIIFNVGLEKYFLQNRTDWKVKPVLLFGFAPAVVISTPYELTFFRSLKKIQLSYGVGVFAALGFDWQAFQKIGINLTARYAFIPVLFGKEIYYYKGFLVKNVGGFYVNLGITLLKEYFGKK